jgi:hypothetical protein
VELNLKKALALQQWMTFCLCEKYSRTLKRFFDQDAGNDLKKIIFSMLC